MCFSDGVVLWNMLEEFVVKKAKEKGIELDQEDTEAAIRELLATGITLDDLQGTN